MQAAGAFSFVRQFSLNNVFEDKNIYAHNCKC